MGELGALFNPGMRHELEERRARAARREEEGNARDGDLRIDLDSGVAVINAPGDEDADGRSDESAVTTGVTSGSTRDAGAAPDDSPAGGSARTRDVPGSDSGAAPTGADSAESDDPDAPAAAGGPSADPSAEPAAAPRRPRGKRARSAGRR
ncbi:DUF6191 domain-containing protein [Nakamurella sp.]|uniref:DUF6191 domain-containing protein n=1 Tax=Nakamurella sp. TaxID=1869182 RepID=UPI003B3A3B24